MKHLKLIKLSFLVLTFFSVALEAQSLTALKYAGGGGTDIGNGVVDSHSVKSLSDRYNKEREKLMVGVYGAKAGQVIAQTAFWGMATALTVTSGGVAGPIILGVVASGSDQLMEFGVGKAEEARQYQSQKMILSMFNRSGDLSGFEGKSPEEAFKNLISNDKDFQSTFLKMDSSEQTALTQSAVSQISKNLKDFGSYQNARDALQDKVDVAQGEDIAALGKKVAESGIKVAGVLQKQGNALAALAENQKALSNELTSLSKQTENNTANIDFLNEFMFGKMSPAEQRRTLAAGFIGKNLNEDQKKELDSKLKVLELRDKITSNVNSFLEGANDAMKIASAIGVDPKLIAGVTKASQIVSGISNAVGNFMSGNFLGALGSICGLFGGGKDVATERHEEVMGALKSLAEGQAQIMEGLNQIKEGINMLLQGQVEIMKMIGAVADLVEHNHKEVMGEFGVVRVGLHGIQQVLNQVATQALSTCKLFMNNRSFYDFADGAFPNYEKLSKHFERNRDKFAKCLNDGLLPLITLLQKDDRGEQVDPRLLAESDSDLTQLILFARDVYGPAFKAFSVLVGSTAADRSSRYASLLMPAQSWKELQRKGETVFTLDTESPIYPADFSKTDKFAYYLSKPLRPLVTADMVDRLIEFLPYFSLLTTLESSAVLLSQKEILTDSYKEIRAEGIDLGKKALGLLNIAIAQQTILNGEMLLPYASRLLKKVVSGAAFDQAELVEIQLFAEALKHNEVLQKNVGALWVREVLAASGAGSRTKYELAYLQNGNNIASILSPKFEYLKNGNVWKATAKFKLNEPVTLTFDFILPSGKEDLNLKGGFYTRPELSVLLKAKARLIDRILDLNFDKQLNVSEEDKALATQMVAGK